MRLNTFLFKLRHKPIPLAVVMGFSPWKSFIADWLPDRRIDRRPRNVGRMEFYASIAPRLLFNKHSELYVWGFKAERFVISFCQRFNIPVIRVEDGFLRSIQLGATKEPPISLCMDEKGLYYDATAASMLEDILNYYDFSSDPELMQRARNGINALLQTGLSKYNIGTKAEVEALYGHKIRKRILVAGQVEGDMSIIKGCSQPITNNDLVRIAAGENPEAEIIYKPHPEVIWGTRDGQSNPKDVEDIARVLYENVSLADAFQTIDHVYTITSLSGFEALLRDIKVTCMGAPFYSGWGLTDDRQHVARRNRSLSIEEIFAASYIIYPRYYNPVRKQIISFEEALQLLHSMKLSEEGR